MDVPTPLEEIVYIYVYGFSMDYTTVEPLSRGVGNQPPPPTPTSEKKHHIMKKKIQIKHEPRFMLIYLKLTILFLLLSAA